MAKQKKKYGAATEADLTARAEAAGLDAGFIRTLLERFGPIILQIILDLLQEQQGTPRYGDLSEAPMAASCSHIRPQKAATACTHEQAHRSDRQPSSSPPAMMRPVGLLRRGRNAVSAASDPASAAPAAAQLAQCSCWQAASKAQARSLRSRPANGN